jgi:prepilin-type N-terminal cleavage/methylation domain-containing protein
MRRRKSSRSGGEKMRHKQKGFSLIELLIVVAIILIIAAIAIPNLLRSKMAANEASAVGSMRTLNTASVTYSTTYGGYPHLLSNMAPASPATSTSADLVDSVLAGGTKSGYTFTFSAGTTDANGNYLNYSITAAPSSPGVSGQRYFYTDQSGVIRANVSAAATSASTPLS